MDPEKPFIRRAIESIVITVVCSFIVALMGSAVGFVWTQAITAGDEREAMRDVFSEELDALNAVVLELSEHVGPKFDVEDGYISPPNMRVEQWQQQQQMAPPVQQSLREYGK